MNNNIDNIVEYFGIKFDLTKVRAFLTKDNYAVIDKSGFEKDKFRNFIIEKWEYVEQMKKTNSKKEYDRYSIGNWPPARKYEMVDNKLLLTDEFCDKYHEACMINFDLNMNFIKNLNDEKFKSTVDEIVKEYHFVEINDLNTCKGKKGIYMMVLDNYKQIYIGQTIRDIKEQILRHWKKKPYFDKVLFGRENKSIISIDSYGFLDTTRIYVIVTDNIKKIDQYEEKLVDRIPNDYLVNRIGGGIHLESGADFLRGLYTMNRRDL